MAKTVTDISFLRFMLTTHLQLVRYSIIVINITIILGGKVTTVPEGLPFKWSVSYLNFSTFYEKLQYYWAEKYESPK